MRPYYEDSSVQIFHGDCRDILPTLSAVHSVVTDPPYELGFMGKKWDSTGIAYSVELWAAVLRTLTPGAHLLAFGGTRTHHRMVCAIEDAGFEIRDEIQWLYGSGFPKSLDIGKAIDKAAGAEREVVGKRVSVYGTDTPTGERLSRPDGEAGYFLGADPKVVSLTGKPVTTEAKQWDGWGTALKPACEPVCVARKPFIGTVAQNVLAYGTGGVNVDGCRVGTEVLPEQRAGQARIGTFERTDMVTPERKGRWPSNVILSHSEGCICTGTKRVRSGKAVGGLASSIYGSDKMEKGGGVASYADSGGLETVEAWQCVEGCPVKLLDEQSGENVSRFFHNAKWGSEELLFNRAKAMLDIWKVRDAYFANDYSSLSNEHAVSVLSDVVIKASHGDKRLSGTVIPSTSVTGQELETLRLSLITAILSIGSDALHGPLLEKPIPNGCRVNIAETSEPTVITMITISHWKSDGSAVDATFKVTLNREGHGVAGCRSFYCAKASRSERDEYMNGDTNDHSTVKPLDLMRYLCTLVTPPGGVVLDPFMGSGSTLCAARTAGFKAIGIELEERYCDVAAKRMSQGVLL